MWTSLCSLCFIDIYCVHAKEVKEQSQTNLNSHTLCSMMLLSTKHFTNIICLTTNICPSNRLLRSSGLKHILLCPYQLVVYFLIKKKLRRFVNKNMHHKAAIGKGEWFSDEETMQFGPIVIEQSCQIALFLTQHGWLPWHCISEPLRKDYPRMPLFSDLTVS